EELDVSRRGKPNSIRAEPESLLDAGTGIVQERQQRVIALPVDRCSVRLSQDRSDLIAVKILERPLRCLLGRDAQNGGALSGRERLAISEEAVERAKGRKSAVAG